MTSSLNRSAQAGMGSGVEGRVPAAPGPRKSSPAMTERQIAQFWAKTQKCKTDECWPWTAYRDKYGYGIFYLNSRGFKAHRIALELDCRSIPEGYVADHICRTRHCVNPKHLRAITRGTNTMENSSGLAAKNRSKQFCVRGHELSGHNLWTKPDGKRRCRLCDNAWNRAYRLRKKSAAHV